MELLIKLAEEASLQPKLATPKKFSTFTSVYKMEGRPILPPLMTPERRSEMNDHRLTALAIEDYLKQKTQVVPPTCSLKMKNLPMTKSFEYFNRTTRDASTNTDFQPLVVMGRFRQKLQKSETLIYDNTCNAIIKPLKVSSSPSRMIIPRLVIEEEPVALAQLAVVKYTSPEFSMWKTFSLTTQRVPQKCIKSPRRSCQKVTPGQRVKTDQQVENVSILNLMNGAKQMQMNMLKNECLQRSNTSPMLNNKPNSTRIQNVKRNKSTERIEKLHPQLWQRAATKSRIVPLSPSATNTIELYIPSSGGSSSNNDLTEMEEQQQGNKIRVKQCMSKEQPLRIRKPKPTVSKNLNSKTSSNSNSNCQKVAASQINISSNSGNSPPMNSVQRRLNYDPRASLKRTAQQKKIDKANENEPKTTLNTQKVTGVTGSGITVNPFPSVTDAKSSLFQHKLQEMEQKQRQRFQILVAQQANEQKRLQDEFENQQQALMDRILSDINLVTKGSEILNEELEQISRGSENKLLNQK